MNKINLKTWEKPKYYYGFNPVGDYFLYSRNRDSNIIENSNYETIMKLFDKLNNKYKNKFCYDFRANHFLCGYVEYILIKKESPNEYIEKAIEIKESLEDYCILDESDCSEKEDDEINNYWFESMDIEERIKLCKENSLSIFMARDNKPINDKIYYILKDYIL